MRLTNSRPLGSEVIPSRPHDEVLAEYTALLREARFAQIEAKVTNAPLDAILAVKG